MRLRDIESELSGLTRAEIVRALRDAKRKKRTGSALPLKMTTAEMAKRLGAEWPTHRVRRHMVKKGIAVFDGGRWYVYMQDLKRTELRLWSELELEAAGR